MVETREIQSQVYGIDSKREFVPRDQSFSFLLVYW